MLFGINTTYIWLAVAVALALLEMATTSLVSIWFVMGSLFAFGLSFITDSVMAQMVVFIVVSGTALAFTRPLVKKHIHKSTVPTNADMIIGKTALVTQPITADKKGRVTVDGQSWLAQSDVPLAVGEHVIVEKIAGVTLYVSPQTVKIS
ncbi:MAG: NfeD family protein [Oscillospiraceae bacterium]|nr:NfeD family protein [Oscillospiraceae bacterium]